MRPGNRVSPHMRAVAVAVARFSLNSFHLRSSGLDPDSDPHLLLIGRAATGFCRVS
jgi:hypothetical protein